jgi:hypothetical protein
LSKDQIVVPGAVVQQAVGHRRWPRRRA